jgi:LCP family protein required for cell wall assembly
LPDPFGGRTDSRAAEQSVEREAAGRFPEDPSAREPRDRASRRAQSRVPLIGRPADAGNRTPGRAAVPPLPGGDLHAPGQAGLPPVPGVDRLAATAPPVPSVPPAPASRPAADPPGVPGPPQAPMSAAPTLPPLPGSSPVRRSGPVPPLPGMPRTGATAVGRGTRGNPASRPPRSPARRRLVRAVVALAALVGVVALYHLALYFYVDRSIARVDALATDGAEVIAPVLQADAQTYLVVGTDVPGQKGPASVTTLLVTVAPDDERAVLLSVPPTALADTPECRTADGDLRPPTSEPFAAALTDGGPSCLVRSVQQMSGLRVDHYLALDLARLPDMVDALGGVRLCVPSTPAAARAAQPLPVGTSTLEADAVRGWLQPGETDDATGAAVAERAQLALTATLRGAMTPSTLADPLTLTPFLSRASDALTVDDQTTLGDLRVLATSLGNLSGDAVQRAALPVAETGYVPVGGEQAFVLLDAAKTRSLFDGVIDGTRVPPAILEEQAAATAEQAAVLAAETAPTDDAPTGAGAGTDGGAGTQPSGPPALTVPATEVVVDVLNGTATTGLAASVADELRAVGFGVGAVGNEEGTVAGTVVRHGPGLEDQARTVAAAVPGAELQPSESIGNALQLVLGDDYETVVPVEVTAPADAAGMGGEVPPVPAPEPAAPAPAAASC